MKILIHDYAGHAFSVQLSRELVRRGFEVGYFYYGYNNTPKGPLGKKLGDSIDLSFESVLTKETVQKYTFIKRWLQDIEYGNLLVKRIESFQPDILISTNTPLDSQRIIRKFCKQNSIPFIFWLQDLTGLASYRLLKKKIPVLGSLIGKSYIQMEKKLIQTSEAVIAIDETFRHKSKKWGINTKHIKVIHNWAPIEDFPLINKINGWSKDNGISDKFCFIYSGAMGLKHNPDFLISLAQNFHDRTDVKIIIVSEGLGADYIRMRTKQLGLKNILVKNYQAYEDVPSVLGSGDVLVAILESEASEYSVPSKILAYTCAGRPVLLAIPKDNLIAKKIFQNDAGFISEPGDLEGFLICAENLYQDQELRDQMGINARNFAEKEFNISMVGNQFKEIIHSIIRTEGT
ncbi:MAG: glycosyltransferase family 4 protein [Anaerolineaceae bacterium]|nr:glycosyltransferase family 4 protein [Anaerolineaceae bacterium]